MDGRRAIVVACLLAVAPVAAGCGGSKKSSSTGSSSNTAVRGAPTSPAPSAPTTTGGRRFIATTNASCVRAGRGKPKALPPQAKPALASYARQSLAPAAATLRLLQGLRPPADARTPVLQLVVSYRALVPALQQTAAGGPTALPAQALAGLETEAASIAGSTGLVACAPYGK